MRLYAINWDGTGLRLLTPSIANSISPSITDDGQFVFFSAYASASSHYEIWKVKTDATGLTQLTSASAADVNAPVVAGGGGRVAFAGTIPSTNEVYDSNTSGELGVMTGSGTNRLQLMTMTATEIHNPYHEGRNEGRLRVEHEPVRDELRRWLRDLRTDGTGLQRVSTDATRSEWYPEISGTGTRIVYFSSADPVGSNPNHYDQLFTYDTTTSQTRQVTAATGVGSAATPATISGDGNWVVWLATANWAEPNPNGNMNLYRVPATGGPAERIGAGPTTFPGGTGTFFEYTYKPHTDMTATRTVFGGTDDPTEQNTDYTFDLWTVDMARDPEIRVSQTAPTLVSWDYEAGPIRYDVIRGDVANLAPGSPGTVDLGPVACLENDSPDADTRGFEDAAIPPAGHAFFFMFRGSRGLNFGPGSWGQSSVGAERVPGSGVCAP